MTTKEKDALNNVGLPQLAKDEELTKNDIKLIVKTIREFDKQYKENSFKESDTRKTLVNLVNEYSYACRWYSLIVW